MNCQVWLRLGTELRDAGIDALAQQFPGVRFIAGDDPPDSGTIDVVFTNGTLPDAITERLRGVKWIHTTFGGEAAYRTPVVTARGIAVTCSRGIHTMPLAEFTEACILALCKRFPLLWHNQHERRWDKTPVIDTLEGQVAVFLGLGAVNSVVARRLHERGLRVHALKRNLHDVPNYVESVAGWDRLPALLAEADFLIVGLPHSEQFRGRLGEAELRAMKRTSHVVNLVTRSIIPDAVLARALQEGWIAGAACNVFENNPLPPDSPLWNAPNLIISPNIAQGDRQRWRKLREVFADHLQRYLNGDALANIGGGKAL